MAMNRLYAPSPLMMYQMKLLKCLAFIIAAMEAAAEASKNATHTNSENYFDQEVLGMPRYAFLISAFTVSVICGVTLLLCIYGCKKCKERYEEKNYLETQADSKVSKPRNLKLALPY